MRYLPILALAFTSCGHCLQTQPTCVLDTYAIIEFYNFTETAKVAFVQRVFDGHTHELFANAVQPHTKHYYRVYPGCYVIGLQYESGRRVELLRPNGENYCVELCGTITIAMEYPVEKKEEGVIRPRRISGILPASIFQG